MTRFAFDIPTVPAGDVVLRAPRESDLDDIARFYAGDRSQFVGGPMGRPDCWRMISGGLGHWALRGYGMWQIADKDSDQAVGACGFIYREGWDEPELGWQIWDGFEGRSLAFQAANAARRFGAEHFGLNGVISYINPANTRSRALATRLGATFEREGELLGTPCHVYRHPKIEQVAA